MRRTVRSAFPVLLLGLALSAPLAAAQHPPDSTSPVRLRFFDAGKWGYLDATGTVVIPPQFVDAQEYFREGFAHVKIGSDKSAKWTYVHTSGRLLGPPRFDDAGDFSEGLASVLVGRNWGAIDTSGALVVEPRFDNPFHFSEHRAPVSIDGTFGYIDTKGFVVIPPRFVVARAFSHGVAAVKVGRQWGLIDMTGRVVVEPHYDVIFPVSPELYAARIGRESRLMDRAGRLIGPPFESIHYEGFSEGLAAVGQGGKLGYIDTTGALVIPAEFDLVFGFSDGRAIVRKDAWARESPPQFLGFIDRRGHVVARFRDADPFADGVASVLIDDKRGYIDTTGTVVIAPQFKRADSFSRGVAEVEFDDGAWGYIDRAGRVIWRSPSGRAPPPAPAAPVAAPTRQSPPDTSGLDGSGPLVDRLARLVERLEGAEQRGELGAVAFGATPLLPGIVGADRRVRAYADIHPDDTRLAILAARLGRLKWVAEPVVFSADNHPSLDAYTAAFAPYHAYLARALTVAPTDAETHYWMGRLYGMSFGWQRTLYGITPTPDTAVPFFRTYADSALHYGRRAVELAPGQVSYREALALYLLMMERPDEASEVVREVARGRHPIHVLVSDWRLLPVPPGAVPDPQQTRLFASLQQERGQNYVDLRVRAYVLPTPASRVEAFYRARWPAFRLFQTDDEDMTAAGARMLMQFLRLRGTTLEPTRTKRDVDRLSASEQPPDGFVFMMIEMTRPTDEIRARLPVAVGDTFCMLTVMNMRRVGPP